MPPRKTHPSEDLAAVAQDAVCALDPVGVGAGGVAVAGVGATIAGVVGAGLKADTPVDVGCVTGRAAIVLSVA